MITLAIIGILGLATLPGIFRNIPTYRVNSAAKVLASEINLARMRAIARNRVHHVTFDLAAQKIEIWEDDDNNWGTANALVKTLSLPGRFPNVALDYNPVTGVDGAAVAQAASFGGTSSPVRATFRPNGLLADPGAFYLIPATDKGVRDERMRALAVGRAGQVQVFRYDPTSNPPWEEYL
jgi:Tfp pilus assembly protein FimT